MHLKAVAFYKLLHFNDKVVNVSFNLQSAKEWKKWKSGLGIK